MRRSPREATRLFAFSRSAQEWLVITILLTVLVGLLGCLFSSRRLAGPITRLSDEVAASAKLAPGNLPRLSRTGIAELDRFAAAFTDLSRSIINTSTRFQRIIDMASVKLAGYELDTYDKEEGDLDGPFTLAVSVEAGSGQMVWFSSSAFLDDKYNALSSGANVNLGMNALSSLVGESEAMAIRSKSLNYNYLTISESTSSLLKVLMIGIVPLAYLGVGIAVVVKRRRMQNEAV